MDKERRKKIQTTKLIITETLMLITIVLTVVILTFVVMGYHVTDDGKIEQSGLVGVESIPTGANVIIDGETITSKTNTSKILPEGEHTISLEKPGYTSWQKTVSIHSGLLTKLAYPRLYKTSRETETIQTFKTAPALFSISPTRDTILISEDSTLKLINLESTPPKSASIDLKNLPAFTLTDAKVLAWNKTGDRILLSYAAENTPHFAVIDLEHPDYSLDLTTTFGLTFTSLSFMTDNGDRLFALENGHLRTISLVNKQLSSILMTDVLSFENSGRKATVVTSKEGTKEIQLYDDNASNATLLKKSSASSVRALISEYLNRYTLAFLEDNTLTIYRGDLPTSEITAESAPDITVGQTALAFTPTFFDTRAAGQVIVTSSGSDFTVFDLETYTFSSYTTESALTFWADQYIIGVISDGNLLLRDFDGQNLVSLGRAKAGFPAVITKDNKYLYLVQEDDQGELSLVREDIK